MGKTTPKPPPTRAERQAAALRANLKRRKAGTTPAGASESPHNDAKPPSSGPFRGDNSGG